MAIRDRKQRKIARRSTVAALAGILLVAAALVLSATDTGGNALPTVLAIAGVGTLMAGIATATLQVAGSLRYGQNPSTGDPVIAEDDDFRYDQSAHLHHLEGKDHT